MATDITTSAPDVVKALGGPSNIQKIENCITRLRATVHDTSKVDNETLKKLPGAQGIVPGETTHIIYGPGKVEKMTGAVKDHLASAPADETATLADDATAGVGAPAAAAGASAEELANKGAAIKASLKEKNDTPFKNFLRKISNIFVPLIPALIGCGIIAAINGILQNIVAAGHWQGIAGLIPVLTTISNGFMTLLPVFAGINAAKEFGGTPAVGGAVAAIIPFAGPAALKAAKVVDQSMIGKPDGGIATLDVWGQHLVPGRGGVLGAIAAAILAAYLEKWARKWAPDSISMLVVPTVAILGAGLATIYILMTVFGYIADGIGFGADWLLAHGGILAGPILAGMFLPLVMLGIHQALIPIHATLIEQNGYTVLLPILAMAGAGQVGAAAAVYQKLKNNHDIRRTIKSALPAGLLGVGEPLIYGVTLPLGRPFITACIGGAFGGAWMGLMYQLGDQVGSKAIGPSGWALFPLLAGTKGFGTDIIIYGIGLIISYVAGYLVTLQWGFTAETLAEANHYEEEADKVLVD
ncbi:MAG: PTS transporter subunit EIIC [Micrococcaceae bacterium]